MQVFNFNKMKQIFVFVSVILLAFSCSRTRGIRQEKDLANLRQADLEWASICRSKDVSKMVGCYDNDATFGYYLNIKGKKDIEEFWTEQFALPDHLLTWETKEAGISKSGDMAYTISKWQESYTEKDGTVSKNPGVGITIWKKEPDGSWKVLVDKP
jgi:ketosteroid isomerase-like protein